MNPFESILEMAARTAMQSFKTSCQYFYEDRKTGSRYPVECIERTIEFQEQDQSGMIFVRTGKAFMISRADRDAIDAWRKEMNIDVQKEPTPAGNDYIIRMSEKETERYEISYREPFSMIGNGTLYRINTVLVKKDGTC